MNEPSTTHSDYQPKRDHSLWIISGLIALFLIGIAGLIYRARQTTITSSSLRVVAAENFWGNIAAQIGGRYVTVTSIISDPNTDPHLYESDARDAGAVASANLVITNGLGYDDFMDKLLAASTNSQRQTLAANQVVGVSGSEANPHLWYNTDYVSRMAARIEQTLAAKDPAHATVYQANLTAFTTSLKPISAVLAKIKSKYSGAPVAYTERVPGYLLDEADLDIKTPAGFASSIEDGNDPSPADAQIMDSLMTSHGVKVLLYNAQATSSVTAHVKDLAKQVGIPVVGVTETLPKNEANYQSWQLDQDRSLLMALGG